MVVFVAIANAREVDNDRDTRALQNLGITQARPLQQRRGPASSTRRHDEPARLDHTQGLPRGIGVVPRVGPDLDADGPLRLAVDQDPHDLRLEEHVEVGVPAAAQAGAQVARGRVLAFTLGRDEALVPADRVDGLEVLRVGDLAPAGLLGRCEELPVDLLGGPSPDGYVDGAVVAVDTLVVLSVISLGLLVKGPLSARDRAPAHSRSRSDIQDLVVNSPSL